MINIKFKNGTLLIDGAEDELKPVLEHIKFDKRVKRYRAKAYKYAPIIQALHDNKIQYNDEAREYATLDIDENLNIKPHKHQKEALAAWIKNDCRGLVVLPTGSGKSYLAIMAIKHIKRSTLIVVPTIDLMQQWASQLELGFNQKIGLLGGGSKDIQDITVSTYDSAVIMMEFIGNKIGFVVFDECHHLPGPTNKMSAAMCIAPFRMGLTATPERQDDGESKIYELVGNLCYRKDIDELEGSILANYLTRKIELELDEDETKEYNENRRVYIDFVRSNNINFSSPYGWSRFILLSARMPGGKEAFAAYMAQKRIARASKAKFRTIWELLRKHAGERAIIFTADNNTAYEIGRMFYLPVITHHTKLAERKHMLDSFRSGNYPVLATSKVLNEGIDVPEASVGIIVSGTGSTSEHVQRLGRILRPANNKQARLYELISKGTSEVSISRRRRQHRAYQRTA